MSWHHAPNQARHPFVSTLLIALLVWQVAAPSFASAAEPSTSTAIQHVIVIIGENRTFDHIFATYKPKRGQKVDNLLSKGIVRKDGTPGPNFLSAIQISAVDPHEDGYQLSPGGKKPYEILPAPLTGGPTTPFFTSVSQAKAVENGLPEDYYQFMTTGGTGLPSRVPDTRIPNVNNLPPGPFQLTSRTLPYDSYTASPVHRFYQMWQQLDCSRDQSTERNPSGCLSNLFPWVEVTIGAGSNGKPQPDNFNLATTGEGAARQWVFTMCWRGTRHTSSSWPTTMR
jgi:phospholipase C